MLGAPPLLAIVVGTALSMSSTAVVVQVLSHEKRLGAPVGRASLAVLLLQDIAAVPVLFVISVFGAESSAFWTIAQAVVVVIGLIVGGRLVLRPLFRSVARTGSPELFVAACLLVILATSLAAAAVALPMELGSLIAGLLLAETEFRRQIETTIDPFRGLLLGVFLISVGMSLDLAASPAMRRASYWAARPGGIEGRDHRLPRTRVRIALADRIAGRIAAGPGWRVRLRHHRPCAARQA